MIDLVIAVPNGVMFLMDVDGGQLPEYSREPFFRTDSCISIVTVPEGNGLAHIVVEDTSPPGLSRPALEAMLETPRQVVHLVNVYNEALAEVWVKAMVTRVRIWVDDPEYAADIRIVLSGE
jgi:hypothetical protein